MFIIAILVLSVQAYFELMGLQARSVIGELQIGELAKCLCIIFYVCVILFVELTKITYDEERKKRIEKFTNKEEEKTSSFFEFWQCDDGLKVFLAVAYCIFVIVFFIVLMYNVAKGHSYTGVMTVAAIPGLIFDTVVTIILKDTYVNDEDICPIFHLWLFEVICCLIVTVIVGVLSFFAAILLGAAIAAFIIAAFPILLILVLIVGGI